MDFEEVYQRYFTEVYRFCLGLTRDSGLAEEITSETFFKALEKIDAFRGECSLQAWLCQIAKNCYYSHLRREKHRGEMQEDPALDFRLDEKLADGEAAMEIHRYLHRLPEPYKEVFLLRVFGELSFREIGQIFGKTESWARVTFYRAKGKIVTQMEEKHGKSEL